MKKVLLIPILITIFAPASLAFAQSASEIPAPDQNGVLEQNIGTKIYEWHGLSSKATFQLLGVANLFILLGFFLISGGIGATAKVFRYIKNRKPVSGEFQWKPPLKEQNKSA